MVNEKLTVGIIQTSLDSSAAWLPLSRTGNDWQKSVKISKWEEARAKKEIRHFLSSLRGLDDHPNIVLLPELAVPIGYENKLRRIAEDMQTIIIAGLDYHIESTDPLPTVSNEAVIIVPPILNGRKISRQTELRKIGKTYAAPAEKRKLNDIGVEFQPKPTVWLFESDTLGSFAVAVCYDFLDLDRIALYKNKVQTLFILAYNQDTNSFYHSAEAIARMVFCNVVVCNCGKFGGSLAISPFKKSYERTVYQHNGQELSNAQIFRLPLRSLLEHQQSENHRAKYKSLPPGFTAKLDLEVNETSIDAE